MLSISTDHNGNGGHIHRYHHTHKALDPYLLSTHHILRYKSTSPHRDTDQHRLWYLLPSSSTQTNINISQVALYGPATILALIFTCSPIEAYWYRFTTSWLRTHKYHCVDEVAYLVAVITISTAQDFLACMLPMFVVYKLRLRQKLGLACVFLLGLACVFMPHPFAGRGAKVC
jgi:hypothetical protein